MDQLESDASAARALAGEVAVLAEATVKVRGRVAAGDILTCFAEISETKLAPAS